MPTTDFTATIQTLSDARAIHLLRQIAEGENAKTPSGENREAAIALADSEPAAAPEDGQAARLALCLLATDPKYGPRIDAMLLVRRSSSRSSQSPLPCLPAD